jgi:serine/threonine-protein kinase ULK/ATG1
MMPATVHAPFCRSAPSCKPHRTTHCHPAAAFTLASAANQADLWSIGTILYELLVGKPPFNGANHMQLLRNIERGEARLPEAVAGRLSAACKGLLGLLLQRNPVERITFEEFFQHPFLSGSTGTVGIV